MKKLLFVFICACLLGVGGVSEAEQLLPGMAPGPAADKAGNTASDPSTNVLMWVREAVRRVDDIQALHKELSDTKIGYQKEISDIRAVNQEKSDTSTLATLASIRMVDREDYNKRATDAQVAITTLAKVAADAAEALRNQVQSVALQVSQQRAIDRTEDNKRLSALELSASQGAGKSEGVNSTFYLVLTLGMAALALLTFIFRQSRWNGNQIKQRNGATV